MKRFMWLSILSFILLMSFGMSVQARPKEVTEVFTAKLYGGTPKMFPLDEGRVRMSYELIGITLSDTGSGLFHGATYHVIGGFTAERGKYNDEQGWGVYSLQNGDKVFLTFTGAGEIKPGGEGEGKGIETFTGGTGKYGGIKGSSTFTWHSLRPVVEGIGELYSKETIEYTLP